MFIFNQILKIYNYKTMENINYKRLIADINLREHLLDYLGIIRPDLNTQQKEDVRDELYIVITELLIDKKYIEETYD